MIPEHLAEYTEQQNCLDHGFVRLVDLMGDDAAIVQAARVSYGGGTKSSEEDRGLIRYLYRHKHTTPLEMCEIKLHCKMPLFVARQWIRHRTANVNEVSGRYTTLKSEFYVPEVERIQKQSKSSKQGSGEPFSVEDANHIRSNIRTMASDEFKHYNWMNAQDVAKEIARINLPLSTYTEWYWKIDLHNLLHFLSLRMDSHAQYEIRVFADVIGEIVEAWCPLAWEAFNDFHPYRDAHTFSAQEMEVLQYLAHNALKFDKQESELGTPGFTVPKWRKLLADTHDIGSTRERKAFWEALGLL